MKKQITKSLALLLACILACSALAVGASAAPAVPDAVLAQGAAEVSAAWINDAIVVTGDFMADIDDEAVFYKFVPAESGYYNIYSVCGGGQYAYLDIYKGSGDWYGDGGEGRNFEVALWMTAGDAYYLRIYLSGSNRDPFAVKLDFWGTITNANVITYPGKDTYILDLDSSFNNDNDYYIGLEFYEFRVEVTFANDTSKLLYDHEVGNFFTVEYGKPVLGTNEIRFQSGGETIFTWDVTLIEHPVRSIEVTKLPNKTTYVYRLDGDYYRNGLFDGSFYPYYNLSGMEVKINYTNGTSKTVKVDYNWTYVDDYEIRVDVWGARAPGQSDMHVTYMNRETTFKINVVRPTLFQNFYLGLIEVARAVINIGWIKIDTLNDVISWLRDRALGRA